MHLPSLIDWLGNGHYGQYSIVRLPGMYYYVDVNWPTVACVSVIQLGIATNA